MRIKNIKKNEEFEEILLPEIDKEKDNLTNISEVIKADSDGLFLEKGNFKSPNFVKKKKGWMLEDAGKVWLQELFAGSATNYLSYDVASGAQLVGKITAVTGAIGGWTISSSALYLDGATNNVSSGMASSDFSFYAGKKYTDRATAPFRVTPAGALVASSATITGSLTTGVGSAIDGQYLGNLSVATGALANLSVTAGKIENATITTTQISGTAAITGGQIANATITGGNIGATTIEAGNIVNATITGTQIASTTIAAGNIVNGTITTTQIDASAGIIGGQIDSLTITAGNIANLTITSSQIANTTITGAKILGDTITGNKLKIGNQSWSHDLVFSSTNLNIVAWALGTITMADGSTTYNIVAGNTGGMTDRTYIYLNIAVSTTVLQTTTTAGTAVGDGKILIAVAEDSTTEASFQVYGGIGGIAISGGNIENASIVADQIATNAITEAKILADAITATKIAVNGLDGATGNVATDHIIAGMIQTNAVTSVKILADAVTASKINVVGLDGASGRILIADTTDADTVTSGINSHATTLITAGKIVISGATNLDDWRKTGDLTKIDGGTISTGTVTATQILADTITANEIASNTITAGEIFAGTITTTEIAATTITAGNIAAGTITGTEIAATTIAAGNIVANTITSSQLTTAAFVTASANITDGIITTAKIGNLEVTDAKINTLAVSKLTAGSITSKAITLAVSAGTGDAKIQAGKTDFGDDTTGFILGIDDSDSDKAKFEIGNVTDYLKWNGTNVKMLCSSANAITVEHGSDILLNHGGDIKFTSVTAPIACTAALIEAAGNVNVGTHKYKVTFVNVTGETKLGTISNTITTDATHKQVALTAIPVSTSGSVTKRKIYRTKAGGIKYYLLTTIHNTADTTYTDNIADVDLTGHFANYRANDSFGKIIIDNVVQASFEEANLFLGYNAGYNNMTEPNIFLGANAGQNTISGNYNIFLGFECGKTNITGINNIYIGHNSGHNNINGQRNVFMGIGSGYTNLGSYNIFLGYSAGYNETGSNKLYIDSSNTSIPLIYGDFSTKNLGINLKSFGGGTKVISIADATMTPSSNPTGGGILYCQSGALKYRGSSGTITTIANA